MEDRVPGALIVSKDASTGSYGVYYQPADFGRGGRHLIQLTKAQTLELFEKLQVTNAAKNVALATLEETDSCQLNDLAVLRATLQTMKLID